MGNFVITIARQYGSGGRTVGEMLAKKLGIKYYDKDIIRMASDDSGINLELFGRVDEYTSVKKPLFEKSNVYKGELIPPQSKNFTSDENLFNYQAKIIRELAEKESCVIIGRCSNIILKDYENVLSVFIHAPWECRKEAVADKLGRTEKEIEKYLEADDKRKLDYCQRFTGTVWTDATNYDLCINSAKLGSEKCVEEIINRLEL